MIAAAVLVALAAVLLWAAARRRRPLPQPVPQPVPIAPRRTARSQQFRGEPHALYHYLHRYRPGRIYIGISSDPPVRARRHLTDPRSQRWLPYSTGRMVVVRWYPDYATAHAAEVAAIAAARRAGEQLANTQHNPRRNRRAAAR